jgi:hypothetical protein
MIGANAESEGSVRASRMLSIANGIVEHARSVYGSKVSSSPSILFHTVSSSMLLSKRTKTHRMRIPKYHFLYHALPSVCITGSHLAIQPG